MNLEKWQPFIESLDYHPLFVTVSGAHIYGFPSVDSDIDLRGCHVLPLSAVIGLAMPKETIDRSSIEHGTEVDIVSHDVGKYLRLLVKNNGYVMEQIFSPLVVMGKPFLDRLRPIASRCITRFHYHHYRGFFETKLKLLEKETTKKAKSLLYAYRVLLTGIHLMKTGRIETDIRILNDDAKLNFIPELIQSKQTEHIRLQELDWDFHRSQLNDLKRQLDQAFDKTDLPSDRDSAAVNELLVDLRLNYLER